MPRAEKMTVRRIAKETGYSERTIHRWISKGVFFTPQELVDMQEEMTNIMLKKLAEKGKESVWQGRH
ncbi:MAG: helix-turn-helix domain-containing protein [Cyclobacteriaceae bacterium]